VRSLMIGGRFNKLVVPAHRGTSTMAISVPVGRSRVVGLCPFNFLRASNMDAAAGFVMGGLP
jgi:hypothetical protein